MIQVQAWSLFFSLSENKNWWNVLFVVCRSIQLQIPSVTFIPALCWIIVSLYISLYISLSSELGWFHHLLAAESHRARTLTTCDTFTLQKAKNSEKQRSGVDFFQWKLSTFFLCGPRFVCGHLFDASRHRRPCQAARPPLQPCLNSIPTLLLFISATTGLTFESSPFSASKCRF